MAAPDEPIVLASGDDTFRAALSDALAPAGMLVVSVAEPPSPTIGDVASTSRELADGQRASATVWLVLAGDGATLVTYDREVDRVLVRSLPYRSPLTPTQAAEAARMARTMLRALRVTPDLNLPPPRAVDAAAVRAHAATPSIVAAPPVASELALEVGGGVRVGGPTSNAGAVGMMAIIWRPDRLGAVLSGAFAPSSDVRTSMFTGAAADDSLALSVRLPWRLSDQIAIAASAGVAVHRVALEGSLPDGGSTSVARIDPAAHAGLTCTYDFGSFSLDLGVTADGLLRRQAYEIGTIEVLRIPVFQLSAGLGLTARIL
jgi:hypothetical protein